MGTRVLRFMVNDTAGDTTATLVEIDDPSIDGNVAVSRQAAERARRSLEDALRRSAARRRAYDDKIRALGTQPNEISMEFGIKFTAEANALIAKTALEGNIKVTLRWNRIEG